MEIIGGVVVLLVALAVAVGLVWFWIWALIDAARASRVGWVVGIAIFQVFGAAVYVLWKRSR